LALEVVIQKAVSSIPVNGDIWIANSKSNTIGHLQNDGTLVGTVTVGNNPFGIAIDRSGKIWVINNGASNVMRIDPALNGGVGGVDLTIPLSTSAGPLSYSDLTSSTLSLFPPTTFFENARIIPPSNRPATSVCGSYTTFSYVRMHVYMNIIRAAIDGGNTMHRNDTQNARVCQ